MNNLIYLEAQVGRRISLWFCQTTQRKTIEAALRSTVNAIWNRV